MTGVRKIILSFIEPNTQIIDIGCGTGDLVFCLSSQSEEVIGLDLNGEMLKYADQRKRRSQIKNVVFISRDANDLDSFFLEKPFDYVVFSMVLHQLNIEEGNKILKSAGKMAKYIILADFVHPLPQNAIGLGAGMIERMAGGQHYAHFKKYQEHGGLDYFMNYHKLAVIENRIGGLGAIRIIQSLSKDFNKQI